MWLLTKIKEYAHRKITQYKQAADLGFQMGRIYGKDYWKKVDEVEEKIGVNKVDEWLAKRTTGKK